MKIARASQRGEQERGVGSAHQVQRPRYAGAGPQQSPDKSSGGIAMNEIGRGAATRRILARKGMKPADAMPVAAILTVGLSGVTHADRARGDDLSRHAAMPAHRGIAAWANGLYHA